MPKTSHRPLSVTTCKQIADLMGDYLTGTLRPPVAQQFAKHLSICPDCVSFVNTYKKTKQSTATLRAEDLPPKVRANALDFLRKKLRQIVAVIVYLATHLSA